MVGVYLSGTGNTRHCVERFVSLLDSSAKAYPIESKNAVKAIKNSDVVVIGYPVQYSNVPVMVRDFIKSNSDIWKGKKVFCIATMALFSGDGSGCGARLLQECGATVLGGLHIKMPDSIGDVKLLKTTAEENKQIISHADLKLLRAATAIKNGVYPQEGLGSIYRMAGFLGQRLWFYGMTNNYSKKLKISDECVGCGKCEKLCPMNNIKIENKKAISSNKCTMCYRCVNQCPQKAITLIGKEVHVQYRFEDYA